MNLVGIAGSIRQLQYPDVFRIDAGPSPADWSAGLLALLAEATRPPEPPTSPVESNDRGEAGVDLGLVKDVCNSFFHLRRGLLQLVSENSDADGTDALEDSVECFDEELLKHGIECVDLTDEPYTPGRLDFDALGVPKPVDGLDRPRIGRLERPAIRVAGNLIQTAIGRVHEPT